nr:MAG TPA: hypothetical protein [Caudoviricetes sp.]
MHNLFPQQGSFVLIRIVAHVSPDCDAVGFFLRRRRSEQ